MTALPVACTFTPGELRARAADLLPGLASIAGSRAALPNGVRLEFAPRADTLRRIDEVVARERRCCAFLDFRLDTRAPSGALVLDVTGPVGTEAFLAELLGEARGAAA